MSIEKEFFGRTKDGKEVMLYTITNKNGMTAKISTYGAVLVSLLVPDKTGKLKDVVLGYDSLEPYFENAPGFGAVIGRNANRIANGTFSLNGKTYQLLKNDGENNLHSGPKGFQHGLWKAEEIEKKDKLLQGLMLSYHSPDGQQGFPGSLDAAITYILTEDNSLILDYKAVSDADTVVNLTNHTYFNLAGHDSGSVLKQKVYIDGDYFTPADKNSIPTGELAPVAGTPMDFTTLKPIGQDIDAEYEPLAFGGGYDHNWVLKTKPGHVVLVAKMVDEDSGRIMEVYTDSPGLQFYTANFLNGEIGKDGVVYESRGAACFETQFFPDGINKEKFQKPILKKGEVWDYTTIYKFL